MDRATVAQHGFDQPFQHLEVGGTYRVVSEFTDYDGGKHAIGERWVYLGKNFVPYVDGLTLFLEINGEPCEVRMQWTYEEQGAILESLAGYIVAETG